MKPTLSQHGHVERDVEAFDSAAVVGKPAGRSRLPPPRPSAVFKPAR